MVNLNNLDHRKYSSIKRVHTLLDTEPEIKEFDIPPYEYVITEKVHGCNLSVYITPDDFRFSSRNKKNPGIEFYNVAQYAEGTKFLEMVDAVQEYIKDKPDLECVRLTGEYYGGKGPGAGVHEDRGRVQCDPWVNYCWDNRYVVFDVEMYVNGEWQHPMYYTEARVLVTRRFKAAYVPVLTRVNSWEKVKEFIRAHSPCDGKSLLKGSEHANIEGYVIRRYTADRELYRPMLKYTRSSVKKREKSE